MGGTPKESIEAPFLPCCVHGLGVFSRGVLLVLGKALSREIKGGTSPVLTGSVPLSPCGATGLEVLLLPGVRECGDSKEQGQTRQSQPGLLSISP